LYLIDHPVGVGDPGPRSFISYLGAPVPNPFSGTTTVNYSIAQAGRVELGVYDTNGRLVRRLVDGQRDAGAQTVVWDGIGGPGSRFEAGVYFIRLIGPGICLTRKAVLLR
jgi:hypothetical protein